MLTLFVITKHLSNVFNIVRGDFDVDDMPDEASQ